MLRDYTNKAVLITGGTKGIGLATGLAFGQRGAQVYLTHKWGSASEDEVRRAFAEMKAIEPCILEADVTHDDDTVRVFDKIGENHDHLEVLISNVCVVQPANGLASLKKRSLMKSLEYSAWPIIAYVNQALRAFDKYPRYVMGVSSDGPDHYFSHYEYVAVSKAVMETLCRYMSVQLQDHDVRINVLRTRNVMTDAVNEIFGPDYRSFLSRYAGEEYFMSPQEVGDAIFALCSGFLDAVSGQVIQVDKGMAFADTVMRLFDNREALGLLGSNEKESIR